MIGILFDLDGTLLNSETGIVKSIAYSLEKAQRPELPYDTMRLFIGPPLVDSYAKHCHLSKFEAEEMVDIFRERYLTLGKFENEVYEGIVDILQRLQRDDVIVGVATAKTERTSKEILEHYDLASYFDLICGAMPAEGRLYKLDVLREALKKLSLVAEARGTSVDRIYMIGDRLYDMEAAKDMGCVAVGVDYGFGSVKELRDAGADFICSSALEVLDCISKDSGLSL